MSNLTTTTTTTKSRGVWAQDEHERFLQALHYYPNGPWKAIAQFVGTRTIRQVQTHAQKYHEKAARRLRDLLHSRERSSQPAPSIDSEMHQICETLHLRRVPLSPRSTEHQQRSVELATEIPQSLFCEDDVDRATAREEVGVPVASHEDLCFNECLDFLIETLDTTNDDNTTVLEAKLRVRPAGEADVMWPGGAVADWLSGKCDSRT